MLDLGSGGAQIAASVFSTLLATGIISFFSWLILKTRFNKKFRQAIQHLRLAEALQKERQYSQAKDELVKTLALLGDEQRSLLLSQAHMRLGDISMSLREWDQAIHHFILCREINKNVRHGTAEDVILLKLGKAYCAGGKVEDAFRCFEDARRIEESISNHPLLGETYGRLGEVEIRRRHPEIAIGHYGRALNCHEKIGDRRTVAATRVCLGDLNLKIANMDEALSQFCAAREEYNELGDFPLVTMLDDRILQVRQGAQLN
jgi:tetratricopeptide (TPR) repeat protein